MKENLRVAVCLYGQPRNFELSWPTIKKYLVENNNADLFFHFWTSHPLESHCFGDDRDRNWQVIEDNKILEWTNPSAYLFEEQVNFDTSKYKKAHSPVFNLLSFTYSLQKSHSLYGENDYDIVVHCRADLCFNDFVNFKDVSDEVLYIEHRGTSGDQFAYSTAKTMKLFSSCFEHFDALYAQLGYLHAETFFRLHMQNNNIAILDSGSPYKICKPK